MIPPELNTIGADSCEKPAKLQNLPRQMKSCESADSPHIITKPLESTEQHK